MADRYTKAVLTVIALALAVLVVQNATGSAHAQARGVCGENEIYPCYVKITGPVEVMRQF